ncbi:MAG: hypothetical protein K6T35_01340, partial [Meiothermus silvanus]|nr:hypothetical protein [Allomeiothermus silvanus]
MEAFETYLIRERGHTPQGARRYAYDVRWWEAWLAGRSPTGTGCAGAPTGRSPSGPGEPGTPKGRSPAGQPEGCTPKSREASAAMVRAFLAEKGLSARRTQGFLAALRAYYRWRKDVRGEAVEDPTAPVARPRAGRRIPRHPSREDLERLLGGVE